MKEMVGGCCVCSDDRGWAENPLVYCDGSGCTVAVHQACYGIVTVPVGNWYCRKCEMVNTTKVRCELCPNREGALKPTDNNTWAHVVCALYIPEVRFGNVTTMEPIVLAQIPPERFNKTCYICEEQNRSRASIGACMQCNKSGCRQQFHVTCAQALGLLCEEASNHMENVKYCGYCHHHYTKLRKGGNVKVIPAYRPAGASDSPEGSPNKPELEPVKPSKRKLSTASSKNAKSSNTPAESENNDEDKKDEKVEGETIKVPTKRRKGGSRTPPGGGQGSPESSSRPSSPGSSKASVAAATPPTHVLPTKELTSATTTSSSAPPSTTTRPNSIVVTVPLDALPPTVPAIIPAPSPPLQGSSSGSAVSDPPHLPAKRQRSQSIDKSDKSRRYLKRSSGKTSSSPPPISQQQSSSLKSGSPSDSNLQTGGAETRPRRTGSATIVATSAPSTSASPSTSTITIKEEKDVKIFQNGLHAPHMLGNQLNPSSTMAQKMCDTLSQEMVAHSVFIQQESSQNSHLVGPQLLRPQQSQQNRVGAWTGGTPNHTSNHVPSSLEHLLERQWEQGSQFLMEQAQHFDIASLLSCLHQLRAENAQLEEHVTSLVQRRDHLLAVNARLAIPLLSPQQQPQHQVNTQPVNSVQTTSTSIVNNTPPVIENGMATPAEQQMQYQRNPQQISRSSTTGYAGSNQHQQQNSVVVRASSSDRRSSSSGSTYNSHSNPHGNPLSSPHSHSAPHNPISNPHSNQGNTIPTSHGNPHPNQSMFSSNQQQSQSQQSQVVMRRDVISELHHGMNSAGGGSISSGNPSNSCGVGSNSGSAKTSQT